MPQYNPFSKEFDEITAIDLDVLRDVSEGWYVEYKQQVPSARKEAAVGKSLGAFANHYGGWLFYGIQSDKDSRVAQAFPGIAVGEIVLYEQTLRDAARHHVNPPPFFQSRILKGPAENIGLPADRALIVVQVPSGHNAPYIHSSGRIYRRVADASDPKPENDRATLDLLYERGQRDRARLTAFLNQTPILSDYESKNLSYVQAFLMVDPLGDRNIRANMSFERFAEVMAEQGAEAGGIPFENVMSTAQGGVARQIANNNPYNMTLTWKFSHDLSSVIIIPLSSVSIDSGKDELRRFLRGYKYSESLIQGCVRTGLNAGSVIDTNFVFMVLTGLVSKYRYWVKENGFSGTIYGKASVHNVWRRVPYLDLEGYAEFLSGHGVPLIQDYDAMTPPGTDPNTLVEIDWRDFSASHDDQVWQVSASFQLWRSILSALGLPFQTIFAPHTDKFTRRFDEVWELTERVKEAHRMRKIT